MKLKNYIATILSVYLFALMVMPCNDGCNSHPHEEPITIQQAEEHHQADNDLCSPFCFCTCCASAMNAVNFPALNTIPPVTEKKFTAFYQSLLSQEHSSIWQPPKLS